MSPLIVRAMTAADAQAVATWRYNGVYSFYNATADPDDLAELLAPSGWGLNYFSVDDVNSQFVGFFQFKPQGDSVEMGLGLHPDLTGSGLGLAFVLAGLAFAGWLDAYEPALERWFTMMTFEEEWEMEDVLEGG